MNEMFTYKPELTHSDNCHICGESVAFEGNSYYNFEGYEVCRTCFF